MFRNIEIYQSPRVIYTFLLMKEKTFDYSKVTLAVKQ